MLLYLNYGLAFWMGSRYLIDGVVTLSKVLTIMMSVMIGAFNLGNVAPNMRRLSQQPWVLLPRSSTPSIVCPPSTPRPTTARRLRTSRAPFV